MPHLAWVILAAAAVLGFQALLTLGRMSKVAALARQHIAGQGGQLLSIQPQWLIPGGFLVRRLRVPSAYRVTFRDLYGQARSRVYGWAVFGNAAVEPGLKWWAQDHWLDV